MKLLAIDGNSILHRAYHGIRPLSNKEGVPTNAVFGFMNIYLKHISELSPDAVAVAFDMNRNTFRHQKVATYKANRHATDDELLQQFPIIKNILRLMGATVVESEGYEADDILGTLSEACSEGSNQTFVLTGDRDSLQLVSESTTVILVTNNGDIYFTPQKFREEYGFEPVNLIDLKALMGDKSDNISGVKGIGEKTAKSLIQEYATIENLYQNYQDSSLTKGVKAKLEAGKEDAEESKWLATIVRNVPVDTDIKSYVLKGTDSTELSRILTFLEMFSTMKKLGIEPYKEKESTGEVPQAIEVCQQVMTESDIGQLDECYYLFSEEQLIKLTVLCGNTVFTSNDDDIILSFFESECKKSTSDAKSHYRYALSYGKKLTNIVNDTVICGYLLNPSSDDYSTEKLCREYGVHYRSENGEFADIVSLPELTSKLRSETESQGMGFLLDSIELPLTEVLASMEDTGICIDRKGVEDFGKSLTQMIDGIQKKIYAQAGHEFNISSPKQLGSLLFDEMNIDKKYTKKTKTGYSTNADVLESLRELYPIADDIIKYRQYTKLYSTYVTGLLDKISDDGRIHTCFRQTETRTGRISSTEPNMQNIPVRTELGSQMRKFFTADSGKLLVDADYSQIELRVTAHLSGDRNMTDAFSSGEDIHTATASQVFNVPAEQVTPEMRSASKAVNFGIIYGIGAFSLSKDIGVSMEDAQKYIDSYLEKFSGVSAFMKSTVEGAEKNGYVTTLFGRKRLVPELKSSNYNIKSAGRRIAMNTPVQGTSADIIKIAMINVYRRLESEKICAKLILQVHDELIIESDTECAERASQILKEEMENAYKMSVALSVDVHCGKSWYEAKS